MAYTVQLTVIFTSVHITTCSVIAQQFTLIYINAKSNRKDVKVHMHQHVLSLPSLVRQIVTYRKFYCSTVLSDICMAYRWIYCTIIVRQIVYPIPCTRNVILTIKDKIVHKLKGSEAIQ